MTVLHMTISGGRLFHEYQKPQKSPLGMQQISVLKPDFMV